MSNSVERFSNRVENYVKYRPDYPREIITLLQRECGLTKNTIIADIGCGPGISARMFLENGNRVFGVEPNDAMRSAAAHSLSTFPWFVPVNGTAEATTLQDSSVEMITAAQAFHWFDGERARKEFLRILKPGGHIVLMWNERRLDATPFLVEYERFLLKYSNDYEKVRHENIDAERLGTFFHGDYKRAAFDNVQDLDLEGLKGRMLSSSYMPSESDQVFPQMSDELQDLFAKHAESGRIKVLYETNVYYARV
jgi:SAM-dependent methyltransferase